MKYTRLLRAQSIPECLQLSAVFVALCVLATYVADGGLTALAQPDTAPVVEQSVYLPVILEPPSDPVQMPDITPCRLPEAANHGELGLGFPVNPNRMPSTGAVRAAVLFTDFSDSPSTRTAEEVFSVISPAGVEFFSSASYGRMDYQLSPHFSWLRMSKPSTEYTFATFEGHRAYIQEAVDLADPAVDFSDAHQVIVLTNPDTVAFQFGPALTANPGSGGIEADGAMIYNAITSASDLDFWGFRWLNHESGHSMGLVDLYAYEGDDAHRFVGDFSLMGWVNGTAPEYLAYERWLLGWLDDSQIYCHQTNDETVSLTALETAGGVKAIIIPTGPTTATVVESRRAVAYDSGVLKEGALVYTVDTSIPTGSGPIQVFPHDNPPYTDAPLAAGETVTVGKVTVTVTEAKEDGDLVQVTKVITQTSSQLE